MLIPHTDIPYTNINLHQKPIPSHWGEKKLIAICRAELKREPEINELFLFYNTKRDTLKLFWRDRTGSQEISKALPRGAFILPAPKEGHAFVQISRDKLDSLFRVSKKPPHLSGEGAESSRRMKADTDRNSALAAAGFIEIDPSQLRRILTGVRNSPAERPLRSAKKKTVGELRMSCASHPSAGAARAKRPTPTKPDTLRPRRRASGQTSSRGSELSPPRRT